MFSGRSQPHPAYGGPLRRRQFLKLGSAAGTAAAVGSLGLAACRDYSYFPLVVSTANHHRFRVKLVLNAGPQTSSPVLSVDGHSTTGRMVDTKGYAWTFDVDGLGPGTPYELDLSSSNGSPLCDPWTLRTFPAPDSEPERFRLLTYTCAGGVDDPTGVQWLPLRVRRKLLARGLSFEPDAVLAIGDHVYSDQRGVWGPWTQLQQLFSGGLFDRSKPVLGTQNEEVLRRALGQQIADLYGTTMRGVPAFFVQDDHDYTENDWAEPGLQTFPPDEFMRDAAAVTQGMYYPEFLEDDIYPPEFTGGNDEGVSRHFGSFRFGKLIEALIYDCRRFLDNAPDGHFLPGYCEDWVVSRLAGSDARHVVQVPSTPMGWTAGKWGEWYPDVTQPGGALGVGVPKPYWSEGWLAQHDRLVTAASANSDRRALFMSGDLHATAAGQMISTGTIDLSANPPVCLLVGTLGSGLLGFPSTIRGHVPEVSEAVAVEEWVKPIEKDGFTIVDVTPDALTMSIFVWHPFDGENKIMELAPIEVIEIPRSP